MAIIVIVLFLDANITIIIIQSKRLSRKITLIIIFLVYLYNFMANCPIFAAGVRIKLIVYGEI